MDMWCLVVVKWTKTGYSVVCVYLIYIAICMVVQFLRRWCIIFSSGRSQLSCRQRVSQLDDDSPLGSKHFSTKVPQIKIC